MVTVCILSRTSILHKHGGINRENNINKMGRICTVFNCRSRYKGDTFKGSVFGFPTDADERQTGKCVA